jgi:peptidoglycan-associated lipoprotein
MPPNLCPETIVYNGMRSRIGGIMKVRNAVIILLAGSALEFAGCAKKPLVRPVLPPAAEPAPELVEAPPIQEDTEVSLRGKEFEEAPQMGSVYFDFDAAEIRGDMREILSRNADYLKKHTDAEIRVDGLCDERGTSEYNLALGQRRAMAVRAYYKSLGVPGERIGTLSWGEEKPACEESTESCWAKNRRADTLLRLPKPQKETTRTGGSPHTGSGGGRGE